MRNPMGNTCRVSNLPICLGVCGLLLSITACTTPGAIAPSTLPITAKYVELSKLEEASSCGYTILSIPLKNPQPVSNVIDELIKSRGGEALMDVTSSSSVLFYGLGFSNCVNIKGKVVNLGH